MNNPAPNEPPRVRDVYYLESVDQLKVLAEPLRYRMALLLEQPRTCAGLARLMGLSRAKAHYHLRQLEAVGLVIPHSEAIKDGIVEKYFVIRGRMLNFRGLLPDDNALPENVDAETVGAVSAFLAAMLQVSGEKTRTRIDVDDIKKGHYFDFEARLSQSQFDALKAEFEAIRDRIIAQSKLHEPGADTVTFHLTNYLTPHAGEDED